MPLSRFMALAAAVLALVCPAAAHAAWLKAETAHFIVYSREAEGELTAYARKLENFDALLRFYHGIDPAEPVERKLEIYLLEHRRELRRLHPGLGDNAAGLYVAGLGDIYGAALREAGRRARTTRSCSMSTPTTS